MLILRLSTFVHVQQCAFCLLLAVPALTIALQHHQLHLLNASCGASTDVYQRNISGNTGIALYNDQLYAAIRTIHWAFRPRGQAGKRVQFWVNHNHLCKLSSSTYQLSGCRLFEPLPAAQCNWGSLAHDTSGVEDARLFHWPTKGLFMLYHSKPPGSGPCNHSMLTPYLVTVQPSTAATAKRDPWLLQQPVPLHLQHHHHQLHNCSSSSAAQPQPHQAAPALDPCDSNLTAVLQQKKQKNWVPFIYQSTLYFSVTLEPHIVATCRPSGRCHVAHITHNPQLFSPYSALGSGPRGNTPALLVPPSVSQHSQPLYLGMLHYVNRVQGYTNLFYIMEPHPPFPITTMSGDVPLVQRMYHQPPFHLVTFPTGLELHPSTSDFLISYGSGDCESRVTVMSWREVLGRFGELARTPVFRADERKQQGPAAGRRWSWRNWWGR